MVELLEAFDDKGKNLGYGIRRDLAHLDGLWHGASQIWVYNSEGEILGHERSESKDTYSRQEHFCFGGHVRFGSNFVETALDELHKEIGVTATAYDLKRWGVNRMSMDVPDKDKIIKEREHQHLFGLLFEGDLSDLTFHDREVVSVAFRSIDEAAQILDALREENPLFYEGVQNLCYRMFEKIKDATSI